MFETVRYVARAKTNTAEVQWQFRKAGVMMVRSGCSALQLGFWALRTHIPISTSAHMTSHRGLPLWSNLGY